MKKWMALLLSITLLLTPISAQGEGITPTDIPTGTDITGVVYGDVNEDTLINALDALEVLRYAVQKCATPLTHKQIEAAKVSLDEVVNAHDALLILQRAVGKIQRFPVEPDMSQLAYQEIQLKTIWPDRYTQPTYANRLAAIEQQYNTKTVVQAMESIDVDQMANDILAGKETADVMEIPVTTAWKLYRKNVTVNLSGLPLPKTVMQNAGTRSATVYDHRVGVSLHTDHQVMGILYNKDLLAEYAPQYDLPAMVQNKSWDLNAFRALAGQVTKDLDGDEKPDVYGVTSNTNLIYMAMDAQTGGLSAVQNGKVEQRLITPAAFQAIDITRQMFKTDQSWLYKASISDCVEQFSQGNAVMFASYLQFLPDIAQQADFALGFVPMPLGAGQTEYGQSANGVSVYAVPAGKENTLERFCGWIKEMAGLEQQVLTAQMEELKANGLDAQSVQFYQEVVAHQYPDHIQGVLSMDVNGWIDAMIQSGQEYNEDWAGRVQKELDDHYGAYYPTQ